MALKIESDRPAVMARAAEMIAAEPGCSIQDAVKASLREHYGLAPDDGIYGGSTAAICMGYRHHDEDTNLLETIVEDLSEAMASGDAAAAPSSLTVTFRDARGVTVEEFTAPVSVAMARAGTFMRLHGTDPDEKGTAAAPGRIDFRPAA